MSFTFYNLGGGGGAAAETVDVVAGETLAVGDVALLSAGVGTAGRAYKADSDSSWLSSRAAILGIVTVGAAATGTATIQTSGTYSGGGLISMTPGLVYGLSSTAGGLALTGTRPWLGIATASDEIMLSGLATGLSSLTAGTAYGSNASGVLTAGLAESVGYAISATTLQIRSHYGANVPDTSIVPLPLLYWRCNDADSGAASTVATQAGGAALTATGGTWDEVTIGGESRNVIKLDGASGSGLLSGTISPIATTSFTVSMWLYLPTAPADFEYLWTLERGTGGRSNFGSLKPRYYSGSYQVSNVALASTTWYHLVFVFSTNTVQWYTSTESTFDTLPMTPVGAGVPVLNDTTVEIFNYASGNYSPEVWATAIGVWNTALSAEDAENLWSNGTVFDPV